MTVFGADRPTARALVLEATVPLARFSHQNLAISVSSNSGLNRLFFGMRMVSEWLDLMI